METLQDDGRVSAKTVFPGGRSFTYRVESSSASVSPTACFSDDAVTVRIPENTIVAWASSQQVSIGSEQTLDDGRLLKILVEKDFACLAPREGEDESDMYPHPQSGRC